MIFEDLIVDFKRAQKTHLEAMNILMCMCYKKNSIGVAAL